MSPMKSTCPKLSQVTSGQKHKLRSCLLPSESSRPRKRKIPLLRPRRGEPLQLPAGPQPGYPVTAQDLDQEKRAALQHINLMLRGETGAYLGFSTLQPSEDHPLPAAEVGPPKTATPAPNVNQEQAVWKGKQDSLDLKNFLQCAGLATSTNLMSTSPEHQYGPTIHPCPSDTRLQWQ
ncbi:PREDICTED: putative POM121-like protein 1-like [Chrysochloris asiatica]|uniref:POM121-like protein 1-like n=1 Tax=Chrysochloris asiatica TaxID=185453 RepID=A0A9B0TGC8_CHRAS|nr:PREDICTED: putative POM121-like protein 1-like [Chrysochloris asiatica]